MLVTRGFQKIIPNDETWRVLRWKIFKNDDPSIGLDWIFKIIYLHFWKRSTVK